MKLSSLFEAKEKNLTGYFERFGEPLTDNGKIREVWDDELECDGLNLTSLIGCPKKVKGYFDCSDNLITSLEGAPEIVEGEFRCERNKKMTSLKDIHKFVKSADWMNFEDTPIKSNVLGLLRIKNLRSVCFTNQSEHYQQNNPKYKLEHIINKFLPNGDELECQEELINAGFIEFAKL